MNTTVIRKPSTIMWKGWYIFFEANSIAEEKMKPVFLAACGAKTYETLKNLCLPQEVSDVDYGGIIEKLKTHFKPEPLIIYERYIFGKRSPKTDERIADFAVDLKRLSASCKFGNFLDEALCMQFVVGLSMSKIQSRLMQESTLAFEQQSRSPLPSTQRSRCAPKSSRQHHVTVWTEDRSTTWRRNMPNRPESTRCVGAVVTRTTHPITAVLNRRHVTDAIKPGMFRNDATPSESGLWTTRKHRLQCIMCT